MHDLDTLKNAARESIKTPPSTITGQRVGDPLRKLIPDTDTGLAPGIRHAVESITRAPLTLEEWAPRMHPTLARRALRRWAIKNVGTPTEKATA